LRLSDRAIDDPSFAIFTPDQGELHPQSFPLPSSTALPASYTQTSTLTSENEAKGTEMPNEK